MKSLLFVPHILSRVASQLLFRELDLHFTGGEGGYGGYGGYAGGESDDEAAGPQSHAGARDRDIDAYRGEVDGYRERDEGRHAQRTADILTRLIVDQKFANAVRTMKIYCSARRDRDGSMAFQTGECSSLFYGYAMVLMKECIGMLTNVLPKLVNLKNMYLSAPSESIVPVLRILQTTGTKLHGLSLQYVSFIFIGTIYLLTISLVPLMPLPIFHFSNSATSPTFPTLPGAGLSPA